MARRNTMADVWSRIDQTDDPNECWLWTGSTHGRGYGRVDFDNRTWQVHRLIFVSINGDPGPGLQVCHSCDVMRCCNPRHLFAGTNAQNHADKATKGRSARGERNGGGKLTEAQVRRIKALLERNTPKKRIARDFGIDPAQVRRIAQGRNWAHVR